ncbi:hypothetical protein BUALT_Bualt15G0107500 [Buddleja alternifolia]|uniref:Uncharacterized protein n=1 Tax=Buddleja alternifolia TaxID=168488 RepID=A0AAV6WKT2_9LAMI|nr:hypothetical protein BUALT_Bualt15G0107500 [Buddleja alternifolia]
MCQISETYGLLQDPVLRQDRDSEEARHLGRLTWNYKTKDTRTKSVVLSPAQPHIYFQLTWEQTGIRTKPHDLYEKVAPSLLYYASLPQYPSWLVLWTLDEKEIFRVEVGKRSWHIPVTSKVKDASACRDHSMW